MQNGKRLCQRQPGTQGGSAAAPADTALAVSRANNARVAEQLHAAGRAAAPGARVFDERERKQTERAAMPAWDCPGCARFLALLQRRGLASSPPPDGCGASCPQCGAAAPQSVAELRQAAGKHRGLHVAPATPEGFWSLGIRRRSPGR